tara:strand:+ start:12830 stop:14851 length:2022 start_codon:yes stop_codon:yes gene_type:complete
MIKKKEIIKEYNKKIELLNKYNKHYYDKNNPLVDDIKFDHLKIEVQNLEKKYIFLKDRLSPTISVGYKPSKNFEKSKHRVPMLSLSNAFDYEDLQNYEKKIFNFLNITKKNDIEYSVEPKIDGISASLTYKEGKLISGVSRGDGKEGELITENLKTIADIPQTIVSKSFPKDIDIRGEVFIANKDFEYLKDKFANPRNAASGSLRQKNPKETKKIPLRFIAYTFGYFDKLSLKKQSEFIQHLKNWGFKVSKFNKVISGIDNLVINHKNFEDQRHDLEYDIDGLVYKINDFEIQKRLGAVGNAPRWAIAHKFSSVSSFSKILNIDIQVGRTGALTPVAKIKPVNIGGVVVSNATLHNEDEISRKDIRVGDTVKIERAGDVIPHVISVDTSKRLNNSKKYYFPQKCPSCGSKVIKEYNNLTKKYDAVKRCTSEGFECEKMAIEKIKHFISKDALNIDGLGKKVVEKFWDLKFIRLPHDIFKLDYNKIEKLDGWGKLSVSNLKYAIEKSRKITLEKLIFSLGIRHIGQENAKIISQHIKNFENFSKISSGFNFENFLNIDGIGETQINSLKKFFSNQTNLIVINGIKKYMILKKSEKTVSGKFKNKTFMFTGKLEGISRAEAKSLIEKNSGKILSSVNSKLNYLIIGDKPTTRKINQAIDLKIKVIKQEDFKKMLN